MNRGTPLYESLRAHFLFAGLESGDFDGLVGRVASRQLDKGDTLFHRGDRAEHFYYLETGQVELNLISPAGEKKTLEVIGPGRTFAEAVAFLREHRYPVTAEVLEAAVICQIPIRDYVDLLQSNPDACLRLLADVSRHLHARIREIERLTMQNARSRLIGYLLDQLGESGTTDSAKVHLTLPRHVIASHLSMTPETLSRLLRQLADEGLIEIDDRVIVIRRIRELRPQN